MSREDGKQIFEFFYKFWNEYKDTTPCLMFVPIKEVGLNTENELEKYLLPKINNSADNLSNYLVAYEGNKFALKRVTPKYIDISWR